MVHCICYNINGTATTARYADLAENYVADKEYPGTVMMLGGEREVTALVLPLQKL